jgi:predicted ATPase
VLGPLEEESAAKLLAQLTHHADVPETFRQNIVRRAAGVPLFLEEIVRALVEAGELTTTPEGKWYFKPSSQAAKLPSSLRAAMVSRLDRLPVLERDMLGYCAVQGVEFNIPVAERICQARGHQNTAGTLESLTQCGIIRRVPTIAVPTGAFVQPLMQEACYQMLLRRDLRDLHEMTARMLCEYAGGPDNVAPEVLVFHYENAERWTDAARANLRTADRAADLFLNEQALVGYDRVSANLDAGRDVSDEARRLRMLAHLGAATVHLRTGTYGAAEERTRTFDPLP